MNMSTDISNTVEQLVHNISNDINNDMPMNTVQELTVASTEENRRSSRTSNEPTLIKVSDINTDITILWKIQVFVTCEYPKRTFTNTHGSGEISSWDLTDQSGSITLVAFNLNSYLMAEKLKKNKAYELTNLSIRSSSDAYKTVPHSFQLTCTNATRVDEIDTPFDLRQVPYTYTSLDEVNAVPLNSIIDVQVRVLRDFGISTGMKNENIWSRRDIHVDEQGVHIGMTLWNDQARLIDRNMAGLRVMFKNVKVSWFDGTRVLITMGNTQMSILRD